MMPNRPNILFIHLGESSFVKEDLRILSELGNLSIFHFKASKSGFRLLKSFALQFVWLIKNIWKADVIYCWFSDYHGVLPLFFSRILHKPFLTVLGGVDCNKLENLNYGIFCSRWRAPLGTYILQNSTLLLPVDKHLISTNKISKHWGEAHPNGVTKNVKNFDTPWQALPTGYKAEDWIEGPEERKKIVSTVALVSNQRTALIKGWDIFVEVARLKPNFVFQIVGASTNYISEFKKKYSPPENVQFIPPKPRNELVEIYQHTSVYLQLSRTEGFPNVLCEAMLCGCIPVGSPVFGIPNIIGDTGFIASKPDAKNISQLITQAHQQRNTSRKKTRIRISNKFSLEKRKKDLTQIIKNLGFNPL